MLKNYISVSLGSSNNSSQTATSNMADAGSSQDGAEGGQVNTQQELLDYLQAQVLWLFVFFCFIACLTLYHLYPEFLIAFRNKAFENIKGKKRKCW